MLSLDELLAPVGRQAFRDAYQGRQPLHLPAAGERLRSLLDWDSFNALLSQSGLWTAQTLRLVRDGQAVPVESYCKVEPGPLGSLHRPAPARVAVFLSEGASLVANEVQTLHPPIAALARELGQQFAAQVGANIYCSFQGVQAFSSHFDAHDVFAVQTEGEKLWRIYESQVDTPVELPPDGAETRRWLEQARGKVREEVLMRPGDVLYLPRGRFHDAIATDTASLHVTFSVTPLHGRNLLSLLDNVATQFPAFRAYLPPADQDGGRALEAHLKQLGALLSNLVGSPAFRHEVAMAQQSLVPRAPDFRLPQLQPLTRFRVTGTRFPAADPAVEVVYAWCAEQGTFALEDAAAQFEFLSRDRVVSAVEAARTAGAVAAL